MKDTFRVIRFIWRLMARKPIYLNIQVRAQVEYPEDPTKNEEAS